MWNLIRNINGIDQAQQAFSRTLKNASRQADFKQPEAVPKDKTHNVPRKKRRSCGINAHFEFVLTLATQRTLQQPVYRLVKRTT